MMEHDRIADCIAIALVLFGLALASAGAGTFGVAAAPPQADADQTAGRLTDGGTRFDFPIDNVTAGVHVSLFAFPINNATLASGSVEIPSDLSWARGAVLLALGQDMDPY
ncbi:hypothetical protein [Halorussus sp. AFM4]|uniref:hypothetical protein n=1 Tax=Halorussus sp. AFM4 TaxID=3421651 RepID=UPI003EB9FD24